ncbi:MAG TPA: CD225/dispanin family protein [Longimicrobium sp.]|nr:CD225/dispanin family protein [Longimicrobium sp.]
MALVTCSDCGNQYDQNADHCPNCGHPNPLKQPGGAGGGGFEKPRGPAEPLRPQAGGQSYAGGGAGAGAGAGAAGGPGYTGGGPSAGAGGSAYGGPRPEIPNFLVFAIFLTLCCCPPFAIPALINAARVDARRDLGDINGAWEASKQAKKWCFIALGAGLAWILLIMLFQGAMLAIMAPMMEQQGMGVQ